MNPRRPALSRAEDAPTSFVPMEAVDEVAGAIRPRLRPFWEVKKGYTYFEAGDVLFAKITPCMENGKQAIAEKLIGGFGFGTTEFHVVRPRENIIATWLHRFLRQRRIRAAAVNAFTGAVGQQRVPPEFLSELVLPIPPLPEQHRIADAIDAAMAEAEAVVRTAEAQRADLERLEFRIFEAAFPVSPLALENGDELDGWTWRLLTDVARLESGHTPSRRRPEWWGGDTPWIALPDIRALDGATAFATGETINNGGLANSSARLLPAGTVCLSRTASVGFVTVMGCPMATSQDFVNWVCGEGLNPWFLAYALMASRSWLRELASGAVHKTIYMPTLKALRVCVPSFDEQARIVAHIEHCRAELVASRGAATAQRTAVAALPSVILSAAFRGQL